MRLCNLTRVKTRMKIEMNDDQYDSILNDLIAVASDEVTRFLERYIEKKTYTETFDVVGSQEIFLLKGYPITSITTVKNSPTSDWDNTTALSANAYTYHANNGVLYMNPIYIMTGAEALQVTYVGGMAIDSDNFMDTYMSLADACVRHVCYLYNTTGPHQGISNVTSHSGNKSMSGRAEFSPDVLAILQRHKRRRLL